MALEI